VTLHPWAVAEEMRASELAAGQQTPFNPVEETSAAEWSSDEAHHSLGHDPWGSVSHLKAAGNATFLANQSHSLMWTIRGNHQQEALVFCPPGQMAQPASSAISPGAMRSSVSRSSAGVSRSGTPSSPAPKMLRGVSTPNASPPRLMRGESSYGSSASPSRFTNPGSSSRALPATPPLLSRQSSRSSASAGRTLGRGSSKLGRDKSLPNIYHPFLKDTKLVGMPRPTRQSLKLRGLAPS